MSKKPIRAEILEVAGRRFVVLTYGDGTVTRHAVDPSAKPRRAPRKPPARMPRSAYRIGRAER
jgi:hypothetical protein